MQLLLAQTPVRPLYGQVEIGDPAVKGYPQFETGNERAVALPQRIAVATRGDRDGDVAIEVWKEGAHADSLCDAVLVHEGVLVVSGSSLEVGNTVGNELHRFAIGVGKHLVAIYTKPSVGEADTVIFLLDPKSEKNLE